MRYGLAVVALLTSACSGSPTAPAPPTAPTPPAAITLTVHVTATNGGQPLAGVSGDLSGQIALTNADGGLQYQVSPGPSTRLSLTGSGIVPRSLMLAVAGSRDVTVDAISASGFDLNFYRQLVRNGFEAPAALQPVRRWMRTPMIYLKTVDEAGAPIDETTLSTIEATTKDAIPRWTSGRLSVPVVERGTGTREGQSGWITIRFPIALSGPGVCGSAQIAQDGGWLELIYTRVSGSTRCRPGPTVIAPRTVRHELGHALGFFHADNPNDVMHGGDWTNATQGMSARELAAAAVAYSRPVGNTDPDSDGPTNVYLAPMTVR